MKKHCRLCGVEVEWNRSAGAGITTGKYYHALATKCLKDNKVLFDSEVI